MLDMLVGVLKTAAPALATAVAGPMGGMAVKAIADKMGLPEDPEIIAKAIQIDPQSANSKLSEIDVKAFELEVKDRQDARAMQLKAMDSQDKFVRRYVYYFITAWSIFAMVFLPFLIFGEIPESNVRFADTILGFMLGTMIASMFAFLLGSSLGSKQKDQK